jgi:hypothetical protein
MSENTAVTGLVEAAGRVAERVEDGMAAQMTLLRLEMEALAQLMPGACHHTPEELARIDAAVEAGFDNMPV